MTAQLQRIQIFGLHGTNKCIDAHLVDNTLILVGENGSGKTTFLRILFNILARRWLSLRLFKFDHIILTLNNKSSRLNFSDINSKKSVGNSKILRSLPPHLRREVIDIIDSGQHIENSEILEILTRQHGIPFSYLIDNLELDEVIASKNNILGNLSKMIEELNAQVLYLPTYRRIERELANVVDWIDPDDIRRRRNKMSRSNNESVYTELVEFGMQDVEDSIANESNELQKFQREGLNILTLTHFGEIVSLAYQTEDVKTLSNLSDEEIQAVLMRVDDSIVDSTQRESWFKAIQDARSNSTSTSPSDRDQIICHYFLKILGFQKSLQEKEKNISTFCKICSEYIVDKEFIYDSTSFKFSVRPKTDSHGQELVRLSDLSSGEKQIVSLFSHLYLSGRAHYFVLIDEPELSLSVPWQKRFLMDIRDGNFCSGLVAVTHSPFIYDNELKQYAHSLGEFISL